ncbi:DUF397 domain-containing protein [Actinospica acidiphila]|uniref:DUF397 domain-containing protein n=1 Tax=Actinospica acidiphila TaxID=304899 RepID=UPI0033077B1C
MRHGSSWQATGRLYQIAPTPPWCEPSSHQTTLPRLLPGERLPAPHAGHACTAIRASKAPSHGTLTVPAPAFAAFVNALKRPGGPVQRRPAHRAACGQITITRRPLVCPARLSAWAAAASARE